MIFSETTECHIHKLTTLANKFGSLKFFKRYLDDLFSIFIGTTKTLHKFQEELNQIHPTIKFIINHTSPVKKKQMKIVVIVKGRSQFHFWTPYVPLKMDKLWLTYTENQVTETNISFLTAVMQTVWKKIFHFYFFWESQEFVQIFIPKKNVLKN